MVTDHDEAPQLGTMKYFTWATTRGIAWACSYFGRRLVGGAIGLVFDAIVEGANQAFYARLPGHSQQAADSLAAVGLDRELYRFRGETDANWLARVRDAWDDYEQGGTKQQVLKVVNQWGNAGFPGYWVDASVTLDESVDPLVFDFTITIPYGLIMPPWVPEFYGTGRTYGEIGFYYGLSAETDLAMLVYLVRKWKPSRSIGYIKIYYSDVGSVTVRV